MADPIYFHDNQRRAAEHLLDSPFGARLAQLGIISASEQYGYLSVDTTGVRDYLSSGERVLLDVLESIGGQGNVELYDLDRLDDANWDRVIAALFIARGRILSSVLA